MKKTTNKSELDKAREIKRKSLEKIKNKEKEILENNPNFNPKKEGWWGTDIKRKAKPHKVCRLCLTIINENSVNALAHRRRWCCVCCCQLVDAKINSPDRAFDPFTSYNEAFEIIVGEMLREKAILERR